MNNQNTFQESRRKAKEAIAKINKEKIDKEIASMLKLMTTAWE